jgi:hypothetical protein
VKPEGQCSPQFFTERGTRKGISILVAPNRMGAKNDGMCNICELLINVVKVNRPKVLTGLNQRVRGMVEVFVCQLHAI